jgi:hypothetical protein
MNCTDGSQFWIYFVQSSASPHLVKIGRTSLASVTSRISGLQTSSPVSLNLVLLLRGMGYLEHIFHTQFFEYWQRGEWFRPKDRLAKFIVHCRDQKIKEIPSELTLSSEIVLPFCKVEDLEEIRGLLAELEESEKVYERAREERKARMIKGGYYNQLVEKPASHMVVSTNNANPIRLSRRVRDASHRIFNQQRR